MPLTVRIGAKLAQYEITEHLGSGGMGDVYQATDSTLGRNVAVKFLPDSVAHDAERVARFEREARVLASLNHPNIAAIYGLEMSADKKFLVMELVPGETLADVIRRGAIPVEESLHIAKQICDALELAHESGVVHRDLKPANIKVTPDGRVKVLDFGLATMVQPGGSSSSYNTQNSPTLTQTLGTQAGVILGTAAYMSPEQAAGKILDKRTDIWSFGVVFFEMLTGAPLFEGGETVSHVLADVLRAPIDLAKLPASTTPTLRRLLGRCLDRDLKNRLRDIGEARIALGEARRPPESSEVASKAKRVGMWPLVAATLTALLVAGVAGAGWWRATRTVPQQPLMRFEDNTGEEVDTSLSYGPSIAISPDGLRIALITRDANGRRRLSVRSLSSSKLSVVSGVEGLAPSAPFFSPNGLWIGFFSESKLKKISVEGGAAVTLCDVGGTGAGRGGFWGEDENIVFSSQRSPLMRVSSSGGMPTPITNLANDEVTHRFAQLLPGGEAVLFSSSNDNNSWSAATIEAQILKTGERKTLLKGGYFGRYVAGSGGKGYLLYLLDGIVFAAPMDLKNLQVTGTGFPVLDDVSGLRNNGFAQWTVARSGTLAYVQGNGKRDQFSLSFMDLSGKIEPVSASTASYQAPIRPSPDGSRLLMRLSESTSTYLAVFELATRRTTRLTFMKGSVGNVGTWTPDGKHIVFPYLGTELKGQGIYWIRAAGGGEPQLLTDRYGMPWSFSPDGKRLVYYAGSVTGSDQFGLWTFLLNLDDPERPKVSAPELFLKANTTVQYPSFSPDGRWLAYSSAETGKLQVYVRPFVPGSQATGAPWQISTTLGAAAYWLPNHELLFTSQSSSGIVSYTTTLDSFLPGPVRPILEKPATTPSGLPVMMPDGKRFIVVTEDSNSSVRQTHVSFLLNFLDELERRASTGASK